MRVPKYRQNGDGRAFVEYRKKRTYLGKFNTPESQRLYREFIANIFAPPVQVVDPPESITIGQAACRYLDHAKVYYSSGDRPSQEFTNVRNAVDDFVTLFAKDRAALVGPRHISELQAELVEAGYARTSINSRVSRVKRFLRWCASQELIPRTVIDGIWTVDGLRKGRTNAVESVPVSAVQLNHVLEVLPFLSPTVAAMVQVQYLCGMRPQDICGMRLMDIDRSGPVWIYRPEGHKNAWRKKALIKAIPEAAQKILQPYLGGSPDAYLFNPRESIAYWASHKPRKSKVYPFEQRQRMAAKRRAEKKRPFPRYTSATYGKAILYGIARAEKAGVIVPPWSPNQLRHTIAGELSRTLGQQAAQRWLGHARIETTALYDELNAAELVEIAQRLPMAVAQLQSSTR